MSGFNEMTMDELMMYDGGDVRDVVTTIGGVCGAVSGAIAGFATGYAVGGAVFTGPVAMVTGCLAAIPAGTGGYVAGKTGAEAAWDAIANSLK